MSVAPDTENAFDDAVAAGLQNDARQRSLGQMFTIFVESGLHAGTVQRLGSGSYTIGSELEADIILSDDGVRSIHLVLDLDPRGLRLEPLQGAVAIDGESAALEPGGERHLAFPASFQIGKTAIRITAPADTVQTRRRRRLLIGAAACAMLAVVTFQIINPFAGSAPGETAQALMQPAESLPESFPADSTAASEATEASPQGETGLLSPEDAAEAKPDITLDQAAAALRERLADEGFPDIKVQTAVDRIMARGEADPLRMDAWQAIRIWFDSTYGRDYLLVATIEPAKNETPPDLAIEAVWSGDDPYLVAGGQRFFVGAHVGDGWMIDRIGSDEIRFTRGDKSFSLTL